MFGRLFTIYLRSFASAFVAFPLYAQLPPGDPLPGDVPMSELVLQLEDVIEFPRLDGAPRLELLDNLGDGSGRLVASDQHGAIYSFMPDDQTPRLLLNVADALSSFGFEDGNQKGLRSFAFHPNLANQGADGFGRLYTSVSTDSAVPGSGDHDSVVYEWTLNNVGEVNAAVAPREVLRVAQPYGDHNIGRIGFNPNVQPGDSDYGMLYIAMGDGGNTRNPLNPNGQDTSSLLGSILRINPIEDAAGPAYRIPSDNPYVTDPEFRPEIWAYGLRNPHQFSWDLGGDGAMFIADIGQDNIEEVNIGNAGSNYGWPVREGTFDLTGFNSARPMASANLPADHASDSFEYPVAQYDHAPGDGGFLRSSLAIAGGFVYRGTLVPELVGKYIFGDFSNNRGPIYAVDVADLVQRDDFADLANFDNGYLSPFAEVQLMKDGEPTTMLDIVKEASGQSSLRRTDIRFGQGEDGEIYVLNKADGWIRRFKSFTEKLLGDFDLDQDVDVADIGLLQAAIREGSAESIYDVDGSGDVAFDDLTFHVEQILGTFFGDVDLDRAVDPSDLNQLAQNWEASGEHLSWASGDFNGDLKVDPADLNFIGLNWNRTSAASVPEPTHGKSICLIAALCMLARRRRSSI